MDWQYIDTENYRLIYPENIDDEAERIANTLEHIRPYLAKSMMMEMKHVDIVLSNTEAISNGFAALAPRMSQWYTTPPQHYLLGTSEWLSLLAIHEMRHINQFDYLDRGFIHLMKILFGDYGHAGTMFAFVPAWYFEGDAVLTETLLSNSGRGRIPEFTMRIRANRLSGIKQNYYQAYLGTYKEYSPNFYDLGYLMISNMRRKYGYKTMQNILGRTADRAFWPYAFSNASEKYTGLDEKLIYETTMQDVEKFWKEQDAKISPSEFQMINSKQKEVWTNYNFTFAISDSEYISYKKGKQNIGELVILDSNQNEEKIIEIRPSYRLNFNSNQIVFSELKPDIRWSARSYMNIAKYDLKENRLERITNKTRYHAPALSNDGAKIAAVEFTPELKCKIVILDAETGEMIKKLPNPDNHFISMPSWSDDDAMLVYTRQKFHGKGLVVQNVADDTIKDIIPEGYENISEPIFYDEYIIFQSPYSGIDNIYAINIDSGNRYRITNSRFGAKNPSIYHGKDHDYLIYSDYHAMGYNIAKILIKPKDWQPFDEVTVNRFEYYKPLENEENTTDALDIDEIEGVEKEKGKYHSLLHTFNFHSRFLIPAYPYLSLELYSDDILYTTNISLAGDYNIEDETYHLGANLNYYGFYPILRLGGGQQLRMQEWADTLDNKYQDYFTEAYGKFAISLPFNLSQGAYHRDLSISSNIRYVNLKDKDISAPYEISNGDFIPIEYKVSVRNYRFLSSMDIKPRFGGMMNISYRHTPLDSDFEGASTTASASIFLPGLMENHSFYTKASREEQAPDNYRFPGKVLYPRGYDYQYHKRIATLSFNYEMPLFYPETALGYLLYIKRFRTNLHFDHCNLKDPGFENYLQSIGGEIKMDFAIFTKPMDFSIGLSYDYLLENKSHSFGFSLMDIRYEIDAFRAFGL